VPAAHTARLVSTACGLDSYGRPPV
jgi:hypothetical protein